MNTTNIGESPEDHGPPRVLSLYDDGGFLGSVAIGRSIRAVDHRNVELGIFESVDAARRAVVAAADARREASR